MSRFAPAQSLEALMQHARSRAAGCRTPVAYLAGLIGQGLQEHPALSVGVGAALFGLAHPTARWDQMAALALRAGSAVQAACGAGLAGQVAGYAAGVATLGTLTGATSCALLAGGTALAGALQRVAERAGRCPYYGN